MPGEHDPQREHPVVSSFADDPEMKELIAYFVEELPIRTEALQQAWTSADVGSLRRMAHQLKGSAGGFGFEVIGEAAGELEACASQEPVGESQVRAIESRVRRLIDLCARASVGTDRH